MAMIGFSFNGKHSDEFGLFLEYKKIGSPAKKKIKEEIPFLSSSFDFSTVGSSGIQTYTDRKIEMRISFKSRSKAEQQSNYSNILSWLYDTGKCELRFDDMLALYFMAEVEDEPVFTENQLFGSFDVVFLAEPFKKSDDLEGKQKWDNINFMTDTMQNTTFVLNNETQNVIIYNSGRATTPDITISNIVGTIVLTYTINGQQKTFNISGNGVTKDYGLILKNGTNNLSISGTGNVEISFRKEVF